MEKLSVALITRNEESVIERCLESLKWVDEIVVLDGYSTDKTVSICRKYTDKIYQKEFESFPKERDFVLQKTNHRWVLSVDADMFFPTEICTEIRGILANSPTADAYVCRGLTVFLNKEIRHCSWFDYKYIRLFNKEKGSYDLTYTALDVFNVRGKKGKLKHFLYHYAKESYIDYFGKIKRLSYLTALEYDRKGVRISVGNFWWYFLLKPACVFAFKYGWKRGFLDGTVGLIVCINSAISYYVAYAALWDLQRKR
jgi:glycosyltransferase involved in cell wall biosynthesis